MVFKYLRLIRWYQWYKNLIVFLPLLFAINLLDIGLLIRIILAFIALCLLSSSYYILNDIRDAEADALHPEKRTRLISSGEVSKVEGGVFSMLLLLCAIYIGYQVSMPFLQGLLLVFLLSLAYNIYLKDVALVDLHLIAVIFLVKAYLGAVAIGIVPTPWLISTVFFTALLLGIGKRRSELLLLGSRATKFKKVYHVYNKEFLDLMLAVVCSVLLLDYILYTFFAHPSGYLMVTIPFATFVTFRYIYLVLRNDKAIRNTHNLLADRQIIITALLWLMTSISLMYVLKA